ncbi:MAG: ubiquitinyl hydrolase 1 [Paramarteilia canceri]
MVHQLLSDPEVFQQFATALGASNIGFGFVLKFEENGIFPPEDIKTVPIAVITCSPVVPVQTLPEDKHYETNDLFFTKQEISNTCGSIAILHALLNNPLHIKFQNNSFLDNFKNEVKGKMPSEIGKILANKEEFLKLHNIGSEFGESSIKDSEENHFVCYVLNSGKIVSLDGRTEKPFIIAENSSEINFLDDCFAYLKEKVKTIPSMSAIYMYAKT